MKPIDKALKYLNSFTNYELLGMDGSTGGFDISKVRRALDELGSPDSAYKVIHVAGTKGKGSTCAFINSILEAHGFTTGLFTSPHLYDPRERIKVSGEMIEEDALADLVDMVSVKVTPEEGFTYFEALTIMAALHFKKRNVEYAVFETGLGGRLDATNVLSPEAVAITPVSYDHMNVLGSRLEDIAKEKAAIIKKGCVCISAPQKEAALRVIEEKCASEKVEMHYVGGDIRIENALFDAEGGSFDIVSGGRSYRDCRISLPGDFQLVNAAVACAVCGKVLADRFEETDLKAGLQRAFIPGRMEMIAHNPSIIIDGAQNAESASRLKYSIEEIYKYDRLLLLLGMSKDKDIKGLCEELSPAADKVILTKVDMERAADPVIMRGYFKGKDVRVTGDVKEALGTVFAEAGGNDLVLVTGSFFLIGQIRQMLS